MMSALLSKNFWRGFVSGAVALATVYVVHLVQKAPPVHPETCPETGHIPSDIEYLWAAYNIRNASDPNGKILDFDQVIRGWLYEEKNKIGIEIDGITTKYRSSSASIIRGTTDYLTKKTGPFVTLVTINNWSYPYIDRCLNYRNVAGD